MMNILEESNFSIFEQKDELNKMNESFQQLQSQLSLIMTQMHQPQK